VTDWAPLELKMAEGNEYLSGKQDKEMGRRQINSLEQHK
jgi:hypothetical protein